MGAAAPGQLAQHIKRHKEPGGHPELRRQNDHGHVEAAAAGAEAQDGGHASRQGHGAQGGPAEVRAKREEGVGQRQPRGRALEGGEEAQKSPSLSPKRGQEEEEGRG